MQEKAIVQEINSLFGEFYAANMKRFDNRFQAYEADRDEVLQRIPCHYHGMLDGVWNRKYAKRLS